MELISQSRNASDQQQGWTARSQGCLSPSADHKTCGSSIAFHQARPTGISSALSASHAACSHPQPCWLTAPSPQICSALPLPSHCAKEHLPTLTLTMTNFTSKIQTSTVLIVRLNIYILSAKNNSSFKKHVTLLAWEKNSSSEIKVTYFKVIQLSCFLLFLMIVVLSFIQQFSFLLVLMDFIFAWATLWCWGYIYSDGRGSNMAHKQLSHFCNFFFYFTFKRWHYHFYF